MEKKNQLHQLLAVESDLRQQSKKITQEARETFQSRRDHFDGMSKTYKHNVEDEAGRIMEIPPEEKLIVTTVDEKMNFVQGILSRTLDVMVSKEETNASGTAVAHVEIGSGSYEMSATALLALEGFLKEIRTVYDLIPTLDPVREWTKDGDREGAFKTKELQTFRTEKKAEVIVLAEATKEFPAQTNLVNVDRQVGVFSTVYKSGRFTVKRKADCIANIDSLLREVKKARSSANRVEAKNIKIAKAIFEAINK